MQKTTKYSIGSVVAAIALAATSVAAAPAKHGKAAPAPSSELAAAKAALAAPDVAAAIKAVAELAAADSPGAHDILLDALAGGLPPTVAVPALAAISLHPAPADAVTLAWYAKHHDQSVRTAALTALSPYPDKMARGVLLDALGDSRPTIRAAAAAALAKAKAKDAVPRLFALLSKGDVAAVKALAAMADPELSRAIGEQLGQAPDSALASCLGQILLRSDFGPDDARLQVVRALAKITGPDAVSALTDYVDKTPPTPPRQSRKEAEGVINARLGGAQ